LTAPTTPSFSVIRVIRTSPGCLLSLTASTSSVSSWLDSTARPLTLAVLPSPTCCHYIAQDRLFGIGGRGGQDDAYFQWHVGINRPVPHAIPRSPAERVLVRGVVTVG
jgi:hypothetical protein